MSKIIRNWLETHFRDSLVGQCQCIAQFGLPFGYDQELEELGYLYQENEQFRSVVDDLYPEGKEDRLLVAIRIVAGRFADDGYTFDQWLTSVTTEYPELFQGDILHDEYVLFKYVCEVSLEYSLGHEIDQIYSAITNRENYPIVDHSDSFTAKLIAVSYYKLSLSLVS